MTAFALFLALSSPPDYHGVPGVAMSYEPIVSYWADVYLVPRSLAMRVMVVESRANPLATGNEWVKRGKRWVRGKVLAEGAFMVSVRHRAEHVARARLRRFDPWNVSDSARVGLAFLGYLLAYFPDRRAAVAGYNAGRERAARWYYDGEALPAETREYVKKILGGRP